MPSRIELENRARVVGIDASLYPNDSKLEQRVIYNENNASTVAAVLATGTLTSDATNNSDGETVTIGPVVYTWKTALTEALASGTVTSSNAANASDGDTVLAGGVLYTFRTTISRANDVHIGTTADNSLTNLVSAITLAGTIGTDYGLGTVVNPVVTATGPSSHVVTVTALKVGTFANSLALAAVGATLSTSGAFLTGGVNPVANQVLIGVSAAVSLDNLKDAINLGTIAGTQGTTYSNGTVAHPLVTATTNTNTQQVVQAIAAANNQAIATTETGAHTSWGAATITGGTQGVIVQSAMSNPGNAGGAAV